MNGNFQDVDGVVGEDSTNVELEGGESQESDTREKLNGGDKEVGVEDVLMCKVDFRHKSWGEECLRNEQPVIFNNPIPSNQVSQPIKLTLNPRNLSELFEKCCRR